MVNFDNLSNETLFFMSLYEAFMLQTGANTTQ